MKSGRNSVGAVVIGRNEGPRLTACLRSCLQHAAHVVYVDSGSSDGSVEAARSLGVDVVLLDLVLPFTAARARNAGFSRLMSAQPALEHVQFVDGDCEVRDTWWQAALGALRSDSGLAVVCGRRRERYPERTVYNGLCDVEWDTPVGDALACGGDALFRAAALSEVGGYRADLIAGEEPELCVRLRQHGWRVRRLPAEMTWHDAAMSRFGQWWTRNVRSGHAFAEGAALHGGRPWFHFAREARRAVAWGLMLPLLIVLVAFWKPWLALLLALAYPAQVARLVMRNRTDGRPLPIARAFYFTVGRFAEARGVIKYWAGRWRGQRTTLIEYR